MSLLATPSRSQLRLSSLLSRRILRSYLKTNVGIESLPLRCHYHDHIVHHSEPTRKMNQNRSLSSARPLPDDEHEEHPWTIEDKMPIRPCKHPTMRKAKQSIARFENTVTTMMPSATIQKDAANLPVDWSTEEHASHDIRSDVSIVPNTICDQRQEAQSTLPLFDPDDSTEQIVAKIEFVSPSVLRYTGDAVMPITSMLHIVKPQDDTPRGVWPVFRMLDENGEFRSPSSDGYDGKQVDSSFEDNNFTQSDANDNDSLFPLRAKMSSLFPYQAHEINSSGLLHSTAHPYLDTNSTNSLLRAHRHLIRLRTMDTILQNAQRQGRISFYMTCTGEEAIHIGAASALTNHDPIFAQYREQGLLMWRGFTLEQFTNQCFSNDRDLGKGRQMPIHYGSRALNYHTVSSPLGTQLPQAVGAAYRLKLMKKHNVTICFFGDGCASTTDFHAALNFAATLSAPVLFFCRNNGYAISTPVSDQYAGDGIVSRATGYGMAAIRVDGNDIFAVHAAVREAKKYALQHSAPVLIEGMTYRMGHHSTSDDSTRYRSEDEVMQISDTMDPLIRLNLFLKQHDQITDAEIETINNQERQAVLDAIKLAEKRPKPNIDSMFTDVYKGMPLYLQKQLEDLKRHVAKYPDKY